MLKEKIFKLNKNEVLEYLINNPERPIYIVINNNLIVKSLTFSLITKEILLTDYTSLDRGLEDPNIIPLKIEVFQNPSSWADNETYYTSEGINQFIDGLENTSA